MNVQEPIFQYLLRWAVSEFFYFIAENVMDRVMEQAERNFDLIGRLILYFCFTIYYAYNLYLFFQVYDFSLQNFFVLIFFLVWLRIPLFH